MDYYIISALKANSMSLKGNEPGVYFLFDVDKLVYIGKSWNCFLRVAEHTRKDAYKFYTSWSFLPVECPTEQKRIKDNLVRILEPEYN